jgi:hypothetical protein
VWLSISLAGYVSACGDAEIDARCRRLPPNHHIRLFMKGISHLSRVTGTEHDQICRFLLGIIIDISSSTWIFKCTTSEGCPRTYLILCISQGILSIPLKHSISLMKHFKPLMKIGRYLLTLGFGLISTFQRGISQDTIAISLNVMEHADNFNTEYTERLHIDLAKDAYRSTNMKDEYPQMTAWLDRRERDLSP